ncbi:lipopolysaccharide assembly protein LapB [Flavobacterium sp. NKUCC04_CG]|uniref:tetratricopeptide repeat protein n=1 Tax=Flavobacterium sp. NKUCC04_CG TaxID=2842121 RepID=UPI001C5AD41A|nr:tetratricopeptide repeat protein [Flavobacterium sp. NKUCC04_CG]MBW3518005.1 tetratricopeptide repeat protein [Flavobacterium sp. NKUCC04_CG]
MNRRYAYALSALMISGLAMAQKSELKDAERAIKKGDVQETQAALSKVEALLSNANDAQKAQYYFLKGNLAYEQAKKKVDLDKNIDEVVASYNQVINLEKASKSVKYTKQAQEELKAVGQIVVNKAIEDNNAKRYTEATKRFNKAYELNPTDTIYLYYAASTAVNSKDYDGAISNYKKLMDLGFTGQESYYTAVEKTTGEVQSFGKDSKMRDLMIKQGTHKEPKFVKEGSKRPEIVKNMALIYHQEGKYEEAEKALIEARKADPSDMNLLLTQMDMYLKSNNMGKYEELAKEALAKNPNDDVLLYNLGVTSYQAKKYTEAQQYYEKAIAINPKSENAYLNLAILKLMPDEGLTNKMNALGMSAQDNKKYDELKKEKERIYKSAIPDLKKVLSINPNNEEAIGTLKGIYKALEMKNELKALESK